MTKINHSHGQSFVLNQYSAMRFFPLYFLWANQACLVDAGNDKSINFVNMNPEEKYSISGPINPDFKFKKVSSRDLEYYIRGLEQHNKFVLSEAITLIESQNAQKSIKAAALMDWAFDHLPKDSLRIAVTGTPGVGKSTFIEAFGNLWVHHGHKLSVLAVDPSSQISGGSILGDKTRMTTLASNQEVFIRPSASGGTLGGTALHTKDAIMLCEAAGYTTSIVETVGVGQSETEVHHITDVSLLLVQPGAGDEIQGIKRGIMENADIIIINKADGPQLPLARETQKNYSNALRLFHHPVAGWSVPVVLVSSIDHTGMDEVIRHISDFISFGKNTGYFYTKRKTQEERWFVKQVQRLMEKWFFSNIHIKTHFEKLRQQLLDGKISTPAAIRKMNNIFEQEMNP